MSGYAAYLLCLHGGGFAGCWLLAAGCWLLAADRLVNANLLGRPQPRLG